VLLLNNNDLYTCYAIRADCILSFGCYGTRQQISIGQFGASRNHKEALIYLSENIGGNIYDYMYTVKMTGLMYVGMLHTCCIIN